MSLNSYTRSIKGYRLRLAKHFLLELYHRGLSRETIVALFDFIGVIMALPEIKDQELYNEIDQTSEEKHMSILAIAERKGREEGRLLGLREMISDILEIKFGVAGLKLFDPVTQVTSIETLEKIRAGLKQAQSVAEAEAVIRAQIAEQS